jgi:hypothetical protein
MEILTTVEVEGKTLTLDQTFNLSEDKFITTVIKELFSIEGEVFISFINDQMPYTINLKNTSDTVLTNRFIMSAKQFVLGSNHLFS